MICKIERVTDRNGADKLDEMYRRRIGRVGTLLEAEVGFPMRISYIAPDVGTLITSRVGHVEQDGRHVVVKTYNSIYHLCATEAEGDL